LFAINSPAPYDCIKGTRLFSKIFSAPSEVKDNTLIDMTCQANYDHIKRLLLKKLVYYCEKLELLESLDLTCKKESDKEKAVLTKNFSNFCIDKTSSTILNKYGESGQPCLVPDFSGIALSFSLFNLMVAVGLLKIAFIMFRPRRREAGAVHQQQSLNLWSEEPWDRREAVTCQRQEESRCRNYRPSMWSVSEKVPWGSEKKFFKGIFHFLFKGIYEFLYIILMDEFCFFCVDQDQLTDQLLIWSYFLRLQASESFPE
ncbi:hypothetical protein STEG23_008007, partial [Scotinomys teguina]